MMDQLESENGFVGEMGIMPIICCWLPVCRGWCYTGNCCSVKFHCNPFAVHWCSPIKWKCLFQVLRQKNWSEITIHSITHAGVQLWTWARSLGTEILFLVSPPRSWFLYHLNDVHTLKNSHPGSPTNRNYSLLTDYCSCTWCEPNFFWNCIFLELSTLRGGFT